nr:unnamed protein product [Callosobruchus analis]
MRELSKILLEIRKIDPSITTLLSALRPKYFDIFVEATKRVAKYDIEKDVYNSPTFAINIVTSLKQCCDIAITFIYTKNAATLEADLKTLVRLFETNWSYEVSSHAANNLKLNKWNKVTIVPLASDLRLLRDHLVKLATESLKILQKSLKDNQLFNNLVESVYCRVILLNRRRSGELQRMYLHTYINASSETQKYEEFTHAVSQPEEILLKSLKRVVIRGKRGRENRQTNLNLQKKPKRILVPWSDEQKRVTTDFFKDHIKKKRSPKRNECEVLKSMFPDLLSNKDWLKIKVFVQNIYSKKNK